MALPRKEVSNAIAKERISKALLMNVVTVELSDVEFGSKTLA